MSVLKQFHMKVPLFLPDLLSAPAPAVVALGFGKMSSERPIIIPMVCSKNQQNSQVGWP